MMTRKLGSARDLALIMTAMLLLMLSVRSLNAQRFGLRGLRGSEAYLGQPFGVVRIALPVAVTAEAGTSGFSLRELNGRALYPVFTTGGPLGILRQRLGDGVPALGGPVSVYFLFRGAEPLDITIDAEQTHTFRITPKLDSRGHARILRTWWRQYSAAAENQIRQSDYPPVIETYLTSVLARRLGLADPLLGRLIDLRNLNEPGNQTLSLLLNTESARQKSLEQSLSGKFTDNGRTDQPLPAEISWTPTSVADNLADVKVEPIAQRVPAECFYLRFGSFKNYLWMRQLLDDFGGDLSRMVTARGHDAQLNQRLQNQLGLKESALAKIVGGQVISDVAMIGRDTYLREGAAFGILFQAKNKLLESDLMKQRRDAVKREQQNGASMSTIEIAGRTVSVASTPDNRLRSFYVIDDNYHLVSTSRAVIESFLATADGALSLAQTPEFLLARQELPLGRQDTVFVYLSPQFFQGLMSPQYQIELRRRLRAVNDLEVLQMAQWVARLEGIDDSLDALVSARLVPESVKLRPDGSFPVADRNQYVDSIRGARGSFVPIPDVKISGVTQREIAIYQELFEFHSTSWNQMDPLIVALKRFSLPDSERERLRIEARMLPFDRQKYGLITSVVGPPSKLELKRPQEDIINIQLLMRGGMLMQDVGPHLIVMGLQDAAMPLSLGRSSILRTLMVLQSAPAYLGAWPKLGLLDLLPIASGADVDGYSRLLFGLWRRQSPDGFSLLSFDQQVLETTLPQLTPQQSEYLAQVRVRVGDLSDSKLRPWIDAWSDYRAFQTSKANADLLHAVSQQLGVPREQALQVAESILDVNLICTLGGDYVLHEDADGQRSWVSTAWSGETKDQEKLRKQKEAPAVSPIMEWFRGLEADLVMLDDRVIAYAQLDLRRQPSQQENEGGFPLFNLLRDNPFKSQGKIEPAEKDPFEQLPPPPPKPILESELLPEK